MQLIFQHIPKAGGTTFHTILENIYADEVIHDITTEGGKLNIQAFTALSSEERHKIKLLKGHMPFGLHHYLPGKQVRYITFFRQPVKRIISHYNYILRTPIHYLYKTVTGKRMTLLEFAMSDLSKELDNDQVRLLIEEPVEQNSISEAHLALAKENLSRHFIAFGLMEQFDQSLILFKHKLAWELIPYYRRLNVSGQKKEVSDEVKAKIAERNRFDQALYDHAKALFDEELKKISHLSEELQLLKTINQIYQAGYHEGFQEGFKAPFKKIPFARQGHQLYKKLTGQ